MKYITWLATLMYLVVYIQGSKILALFPLPRESHFQMYEKLMKSLVTKGHEVDVVSYFPQKIKIPRYTDIDLKSATPLDSHNLSVAIVENYGIFETARFIFKEYGTDMCDNMIKNPKVIQIAKSTIKYDLIITEVFGSDCMLGFAYIFKVPIVGILGDMLVPWAIDRMGNPDNPSYIPNYLMPYGSKMKLVDRLWNAFTGLAYRLGYQFMSVIPSELRARELFGPNLTPIDVLAYNTSLLLVNSHFSINFPRPLVPGVVEVAGLHIGTPSTLPASLDKFTKISKSLIYVVLQTEAFTRDKINMIVDSLSLVSNPVIWRGPRSDIFGQVPNNFFIDESKLEKIDVLCNANTGLLITNGDVYIIQEAINCGVPVVGIPLIAEHEIYVRDFVQKGLGVQVSYESITKDHISKAVNNIFKNTTYKQNAQQYSKIFRDRPLKPLDEAIYWIEYVINHKGAKHLRTVGADLIWLEYYNVDVLLVVIGVVILLFILAITLNYLLLFFIRRRRKTSEMSKKDN